MGKIGRGVKCSVTGCGSPAVRSLSRQELGGSGLQVVATGRRVFLCEVHYKVWKKNTKKERELDRLRFG